MDIKIFLSTLPSAQKYWKCTPVKMEFSGLFEFLISSLFFFASSLQIDEIVNQELRAKSFLF